MPAEQLWLDVEAPTQSRPRRERVRARSAEGGNADRQIELILAAPNPVLTSTVVETPPAAPAIPSAPPPPQPEVDTEGRPPFSLWLLDQVNRRGSLSELAKAAKLDRLFPRAGSADDVRARFSLAGADGDAFEALEDAEREYERSCLSC